MSEDRADRRILAAVRFMDRASGAPITDRLTLSAEGCKWWQNRSGLWVMAAAPALSGHTRTFESAPGAPAAGSVVVPCTVSDPRLRWLPRSFRVAVPRGAVDIIRAPLDIYLPPSPAAPVRTTWGAVRVSVRSNAGQPIEGALIRVSRTGNEQLGLTDSRGEALVPLPGIPLFTTGAGSSAALQSRSNHKLYVVVDPTVTDHITGLRSVPADPEGLWSGRSRCVSTSRSFTLAAGESRSFDVSLNLP